MQEARRGQPCEARAGAAPSGDMQTRGNAQAWTCTLRHLHRRGHAQVGTCTGGCMRRRGHADAHGREHAHAGLCTGGDRRRHARAGQNTVEVIHSISPCGPTRWSSMHAPALCSEEPSGVATLDCTSWLRRADPRLRYACRVSCAFFCFSLLRPWNASTCDVLCRLLWPQLPCERCGHER